MAKPLAAWPAKINLGLVAFGLEIVAPAGELRFELIGL